jgi:hypothetical protein
MMTRTAALAGQQQALPGSSAGDAARVAAPGSRRTAAVFFRADGCKCLAFMASASPGRRMARKRRNSSHPVPEVPHLGPLAGVAGRRFPFRYRDHRGRLADRDHPPGTGVHADPPQPAVRQRRRPSWRTCSRTRRTTPGASSCSWSAATTWPPQRWLAAGLTIPLELADCPDRRLDHAADRIARRVSRVRGAAATVIPFDVRRKVETIHARRIRLAAYRSRTRRPAPTRSGRCASRAGPSSRAGCTRRRSARSSTTAPSWRARSPTRPAT